MNSIIRDTTGVITTGKFCQFGVRKKTNTGGGVIPSNEIHSTTTAGSLSYRGTQGDQILLSDGTIVDITSTDETLTFNVPSGKHRVKLVESVDRSNSVSVGGEALVELQNFPTLSTVTKFNFYPDTPSPNLVKVPTVLPSNLTSLGKMFYNATSFNQDISMWDVSNVTDMQYMFEGTTSFNQPLGNWNVSNVTNMYCMFEGATSFNQPLGNWNVSNVPNMQYMFRFATSFNQDISNWNVSNVLYMQYMFHYASAFNQDLSQWCVPLISSLPYSFADDSALIEGNFPVWGTCPRGEI